MEKKAIKPTISEGKVAEVTARLRLNPDSKAYVPSDQIRDMFPEDVRDRVVASSIEDIFRRW